MTDHFAALRAAAGRLRPRAAVVLGSGLGGVAAGFAAEATAGFADVPGLVPPTVAGHRGQVAVGTWARVPVVVCSGRVHFYEGHPWDRVTRLVGLAAEFGATHLILTNAAGGIDPALRPGDLMAVRDHVKLLDRGAWRRLASGDRAAPYSPRLVALLRSLEADSGRSLPVGTYAALTGPCYETPAEIRALRAAGADAVGMSTAVEAEMAAGLGMEVVGISTITNAAAGLGSGPLTHAEVEATARLAADRLGGLIGRLLARLGDAGG